MSKLNDSKIEPMLYDNEKQCVKCGKLITIESVKETCDNEYCSKKECKVYYNEYLNVWEKSCCSFLCYEMKCNFCGKIYNILDVDSMPCVSEGMCSDDCYNKYKFEKTKKYLLENIEMVMKKAGIPSRFSNASFETVDVSNKQISEIVNKVKKCDLMKIRKEEKDPFVLLYGPPGTGKTLFASCLFRLHIVNFHGWTFKFISVPQLMLEIRDTFSTKSSSELDIIEKYTKPHLICLDDIGAQKNSEFSSECLYALVDSRYGERKPTIITTNLSPSELPASIGSRLASRILSGIIINVIGEDWRIK